MLGRFGTAEVGLNLWRPQKGVGEEREKGAHVQGGVVVLRALGVEEVNVERVLMLGTAGTARRKGGGQGRGPYSRHWLKKEGGEARGVRILAGLAALAVPEQGLLLTGPLQSKAVNMTMPCTLNTKSIKIKCPCVELNCAECFLLPFNQP